jgi:hypothetical protein
MRVDFQGQGGPGSSSSSQITTARSLYDRSPTTPGPNAKTVGGARFVCGGGGGGGGGDAWVEVKMEKDDGDDDFGWDWRDGAAEASAAAAAAAAAANANANASASANANAASSSRKVEDECELSASQTRAVAAAVNGRSLFVTGPAGVGRIGTFPHHVIVVRQNTVHFDDSQYGVRVINLTSPASECNP